MSNPSSPAALIRRLALTSAIASSALLHGCVTQVQEVAYYKPTVDTPNVSTMPWGYGLAIGADGICLHVVDGWRHGEPVLTPSASSARAADDFMRLIVWLVPEWQRQGLRFSPDGISVHFEDGTTAKPDAVQVSRFKTRWDKEKAYLLRQDVEETVYHSEHAKPMGVAGAAPVELWDLTRVIVTFLKPAQSSVPKSIFVTGLTRDAAPIEVAQIGLSPEKQLAYVTGFIPLDYKGCRALQVAIGAPNRDRDLAASGERTDVAFLSRGAGTVKPGVGIVTGSITYSGAHGLYQVLFRGLGSGDRSVISAGVFADGLGLLPALMSKGDFQEVAGELFAIELAPGEYEIYSWRASPQRCGLPQATSPFSLRFKVSPGETLYLGSIEFSAECSRMGVLRSFKANYRNRAERDIPLTRQRYPALKDARFAVPAGSDLSLDRLGSTTQPEHRYLSPLPR